MREDKDHQTDDGPNPVTKEWRALLITVFMAGLSVAVMAIGLWCTDVIPA